MATLTNTFEGGSPGAAITTGNSGGASGDAFGAVVIDAGNTLTFDNAAAAHGAVSAKVSTGASSGSSYVAWTSGIPGTSATLWARAYLRFSANPVAAVNVLRMLSSSNGIMGSLRVNATGTIGMLYGSGTLAGTSVGALTAGAWFRVEVMVTAGTTTGVMTCRIFWTPDGATPDETLTISNVNTGSINPSRLRVGVVSNLASVAAFHFDDLAVSDTDWIGAAGGGGPVTVPGTASANLGGLAASASGARTVRGAAAAALAGVTAVGTGWRTVTAAAAAPLGAVTAHAIGTSSGQGTGAASALLGPLTAAATGRRTARGRMSASLGSLAAAAAGRRTALAIANAPLGALTAHATGTGTGPGPVHGTAAADLGALAVHAAGRRTVHAIASAHLGALTATATATAPTAQPFNVTIGEPYLVPWLIGTPTLRRWT